MDFITDLKSEHLPALKDFIKRQFNENYILLNKEFFDWQYRGNMKIAHNDGKVLGYCGYVPAKLNAGGKVTDGACLANLMVDKSARAFGLGAALVKSLMNQFPALYINGYKLDTWPMYEKLGGWAKMGNLRRFVKIVDSIKASLLAKERVESIISNAKSADLKVIEKFDFSADDLWKKIKNQYGISQERSSSYLNWRYAMHPIFKYQLRGIFFENELRGIIIFRIENTRDESGAEFALGRILEIVSEKDFAENLIAGAVAEMAGGGVCAADFYTSSLVHQDALFANGFSDMANGYGAVPALLSPLSRKRISINWIAYGRSLSGLFLNPADWNITKGDGDQDRPNTL